MFLLSVSCLKCTHTHTHTHINTFIITINLKKHQGSLTAHCEYPKQFVVIDGIDWWPARSAPEEAVRGHIDSWRAKIDTSPSLPLWVNLSLSSELSQWTMRWITQSGSLSMSLTEIFCSTAVLLGYVACTRIVKSFVCHMSVVTLMKTFSKPVHTFSRWDSLHELIFTLPMWNWAYFFCLEQETPPKTWVEGNHSKVIQC